MNESAKIFSSEEEEIHFLESHVGPLSPLDIEYGLTLKIHYESNEHLCRLESRRDNLQAHLEKYGAEIFSGYARASLPASFALEFKKLVLEEARRNKLTIETIWEELCPDRQSGFLKIAANVNGKPRALAGSTEIMEMFSKARQGNYLVQYRDYVCTKSNVYNLDNDGIDDDAKELLVIAITLQIWKRNKWPFLVKDDLLGEPKNERTYELQQYFERIYFLVLEAGPHVKLPRLKFIYK